MNKVFLKRRDVILAEVITLAHLPGYDRLFERIHQIFNAAACQPDKTASETLTKLRAAVKRVRISCASRPTPHCGLALIDAL